MPAISYVDFSGGLDRRLPINVQDASRLYVLRNAFVTLGKRIKKRPCLKLEKTGLTGSFGLAEINGVLNVFVDKGSPFVPPAGMLSIGLDSGLTAAIPFAPGTLLGIKKVVLFQGFPYVVALQGINFTPSGGGPTVVVPTTRHHYVDGGPNTNVLDANCPQTESITVAASRVYAINDETVRYCAAGAARDWTTADDAGFLPTGIQQNTTIGCTAVGTFEDALTVFFPDSAQIWDVAVDPTGNAIRKRIYGVGTTHPYSLASWASDLAFLSPFGFRSMTVAANTDRIDDTDVGVAVDSLVIPDVTIADSLPDNNKNDVFSAWIPQLGQYWTVFDNGATSKVWAYTYSRSSKIGCWSEYTLPVRVKALTTLLGRVYLRTDNDLFSIDAETYVDNGGDAPLVEIQMAFQDAKSPGVLKQFSGADFVFQGTPNVSYLYDPRDLDKETVPQTISGDTRPGDIVPVEVCSAAIAPIFRHQLDEAFEIDACTLYFNTLGLNG